MISDIMKLKTVADPFLGDIVLNLFLNPDAIVNCIYGKNGSGKTSISNVIMDISAQQSSSIFLDSSSNQVTLGEEERKRIFVFNEAYIDKNVRTTSDKNSMNAILLFGETSDIDDEIKKQEDIITAENDAIAQRHIELFDDATSDKCLTAAYEKIKAFLQTSWAIRQQEIRKNKNRSPVTDALIETIIKADSRKLKLAIVKKEYSDLFTSVKDINANSQQIQEISIHFPNVDETVLANKLNASYDKKLASELSERIIEITAKKGEIETLKNVLRSDEDCCPVCLQPLSSNYKDLLKSAIEEAFDQTIKNEIAALESFIFERINLNLLSYAGICADESLKLLSSLVDEYNKIEEEYEQLILKKKENIYDSLGVASLGLEQKQKEITDQVSKINISIREYNDIIKNYNENIKFLEDLNVSLAICESSTLVDFYNNLLNEKADILKKNEASKERINVANEVIKKLNQKKKDYDIAKDEINRELAFIFSSKDRLKLKEGEDSSKYYVYSKGKRIKLNKLSTGERNIIALCYFFEQLKSNCTVNNYFKNELLVVIDDPISSFDYENKLSVFSYLSKMIELILKGNGKSKVIVLSHERNVIYSLNKELDLIQPKGFLKKKKIITRLANKKIVNMNLEKNSNYEDLLQDVFEFAISDPASDQFESKGNEIRKLLEAYGTFNYKYGIDELLTSEEIFSRITDESLKEYLKQTLSSLPLNFPSHTYQLVKQLPDIMTFEMFSEEEQIRHARNILVFLFCIDELHISQYLDPNEVSTILNWANEIKTNILNDEKKDGGESNE